MDALGEVGAETLPLLERAIMEGLASNGPIRQQAAKVRTAVHAVYSIYSTIPV